MKKLYYCDENIDSANSLFQKDDYENERRKQLSIETNRRRREMAVKVKKEIEKEERRRTEILKQRKDYQNHLNEKLHRRSRQRSGRIESVQQLNAFDLDRTVSMLRSTAPPSSLKKRAQSSEDLGRYNDRLERAWTDNREVCLSPMVKYSGTEGVNKHRNNEHYLKTFETKLMEQEEAFRQQQNIEMNKFSRMMEETVFQDLNEKRTESVVDETATYRMDQNIRKNDGVEEIVEYIDDDDLDMEDSLEINERKNDVLNSPKVLFRETQPTKEPRKIDDIAIPRSAEAKEVKKEVVATESSRQSKPMKKDDFRISPIKNNPPEFLVLQTQVESVKSSSIRNCAPQFRVPSAIKSILKKGVDNKFGSNPDLAVSGRSIDIRDSVEVTRTRSTKLYRSSSFSQGLNEPSGEDDSSRKFVRFADDSPRATVSTGPPSTAQASKAATLALADPGRLIVNQRASKTIAVPASTPMKPPLHPRSVQEGSYQHQSFLKKTPVYQPPARPKKISVEDLDKQLETVTHTRTQSSPSRESAEEKRGDVWDISVDKTPTEKEIEQLWAEVRQCLSTGRTPTKPESVGPASGRTIDSASDASVRSAPACQRMIPRVKHHQPWPGRQGQYPGQEAPLRDEITVHQLNNVTVVTQQPLHVISNRDHDFQAVSESLEEFLHMEDSCNSSHSRGLSCTVPATPTTVFLPRPPSQTRLSVHPNRFQFNSDSLRQADRRKCNSHDTATSGIPKTQLSMDEDKVKQSLDRLNDRLKNMTTFV